MDEFNYVIAQPWGEESQTLKVYTYGTTVFYGSLDQATALRDLIRENTGDDKWGIHKVSLEVLSSEFITDAR
ncbi:hypothetical protein [Puia dinghuensis]|uniref:Uncharacterized protein n=1 Tax=Puia dinghuensis TaxID=1792502 RepID=A0A8J2UBA7_9BACT|nr:hypothetical protein [Puia dinghuensis]GGA93102.1 hypothetical protein GCM10011511_15640 [Puia dinghuensis]